MKVLLILQIGKQETDSENYLSKFTQLIRGKTVLHCLQDGHFLRFLKQQNLFLLFQMKLYMEAAHVKQIKLYWSA